MSRGSRAGEADEPIEELEPAPPKSGWWAQTKAFVSYMTCTEVHTYAFSVAANVILSLFPFIVLMITVARGCFTPRRWWMWSST